MHKQYLVGVAGVKFHLDKTKHTVMQFEHGSRLTAITGESWAQSIKAVLVDDLPTAVGLLSKALEEYLSCGSHNHDVLPFLTFYIRYSEFNDGTGWAGMSITDCVSYYILTGKPK